MPQIPDRESPCQARRRHCGKQRRNWPPLQGGVDLFAAFRRCQVSLESLNRGAECREFGLCRVNLGLVGDDDKVVAVARAAAGELEADARRSAGDDSKRARFISHDYSPAQGLRTTLMRPSSLCRNVL